MIYVPKVIFICDNCRVRYVCDPSLLVAPYGYIISLATDQGWDVDGEDCTCPECSKETKENG